MPTEQSSVSLRGMDWSHIRLSYVAPIYINKPNADDVLAIFSHYATYPKEILDRVLFVLVDDGSPVEYTLPQLPLNMIVLRINEDIPWNNPGARNLGMIYAKSDKVFLTDIDHQLSPKTFEKILALGACGRNLWRMPRFDAAGKKVKPHANSFVLSRAFFLRHYGYDESLCGHYASDDVMLVKHIKYHGGLVRTLNNGVRADIRAFKKEGYTHTLDRDKSHNKAIAQKRISDIWQYGPEAGHSREFLNFTWKVIRITRRDVPQEKENKLWVLGWWWRQLFGAK